MPAHGGSLQPRSQLTDWPETVIQRQSPKGNVQHIWKAPNRRSRFAAGVPTTDPAPTVAVNVSVPFEPPPRRSRFETPWRRGLISNFAVACRRSPGLALWSPLGCSSIYSSVTGVATDWWVLAPSPATFPTI